MVPGMVPGLVPVVPLYFSIKLQEMGIFTQGDIILITILLHDYSCLPSFFKFTSTYQLIEKMYGMVW